MKNPRLVKTSSFGIALAFLLLAYSLLCWGNAAVTVARAVFARDDAGTAIAPSEPSPSPGAGKDGSGTGPSLVSSLSRACAFVNATTGRIANDWNSFAFRQSDLARFDAALFYKLTGHIYSCQVAKSRDGDFLFYISEIDGDTIADFEGRKRYGPDAMEPILEAAKAMEAHYAARDIGTVILAVPNKETVYHEKMPPEYSRSDFSRTDGLMAFLASNGVNSVYCKEALLRRKSVTQLYYSYDTHWNQAGAYLGVSQALLKLGIEIKPLDERIVRCSDLKDSYHVGGDDDLALLVGLRDTFDDDREVRIEGTRQPDWELFRKGYQGTPRFRNEKAPRKETLLVIGDSFRLSMAPSLNEVFADVWISHRDDASCELIERIHPDYIIFEYVERYSDQIRDIGRFIPR